MPDPVVVHPEIVLGVDLGSSRSAVAYYDPTHKKLNVVKEQESKEKPFESIAGFDEQGKIIACEEASLQRYNENCRIFSNLKRALVENHKLEYKGFLHRPVYFLAQILKKLKIEAEKQIGYITKKAIVTVPAYFEQIHKAAIRKAATLAGLQVVRLINEPTAAALSYCELLRQKNQKIKKETILVLDAGGFTFDASLCVIDASLIDVKSTYGDYTAGNKLIDEYIKGQILQAYQARFNIKNPTLTFRENLILDKISEELKIELSTLTVDSSERDITIGDHSFTFRLTTPVMLEAHRSYLERIKKVLNTLLLKNHNPPSRVLLVGGPAKSKMLVRLLNQILPTEIDLSLDPLTSVALGAALHGYALTEGKGIGQLLLDVLPISLGVEKMGKYCHKMLYRNSKIPCSHKETFTTFEDYQKKVKIRILQGEGQMAEECVELGTIILDNIEAAKKGIPKLVIQFQVNSSGLLSVIAQDQLTKEKRNLTIECQNRITGSELDELVQHNKYNEKQDLVHGLRLEALKQAELVYVELAELISRINNLKTHTTYKEDLVTALTLLTEEIKKYPKDYDSLIGLTKTAKALIETVASTLPGSTQFLNLAQ